MSNRSEILYTPLDLPRLDLSLERIQNHGKIQPGDRTFYERFCRTVMLRNATNSKSESVYNFLQRDLSWEWTDLARKEFPDLIEWLETNLPFDLITLVTFVAPKLNREVPPHRDYPLDFMPDFIKANEPYAYRLSFGNVRDAFFVSDSQGLTEKEYREGRFVYGNLPEETQAWAMNMSACFHGTKSRPDKETLFICGLLNPERHHRLIERSVQRFSKNVIYKENLEQSSGRLTEIMSAPWLGLLDRHPELNGKGMEGYDLYASV